MNLYYILVSHAKREQSDGYHLLFDYLEDLWRLYMHRDKMTLKQNVQNIKKSHISLLLLFQSSKFAIVGVIGLVVNFLVSYMLTHNLFFNLWYIQATLIGFICSVTSNFLLNKIWTFHDMNFSARRFFLQYGMFSGIGSISGVLQIVLVYFLVEYAGHQYAFSLLLAILMASTSNFILNKKWTFKKRVWS
jgi:dolichol-phosphate mannosyltransferase